MPLGDEYSSDPEVMRQMLARKRAEAILQMAQPPQGQMVGKVAVAPHPLQYLTSAAALGLGAHRLRKADKGLERAVTAASAAAKAKEQAEQAENTRRWEQEHALRERGVANAEARSAFDEAKERILAEEKENERNAKERTEAGKERRAERTLKLREQELGVSRRGVDLRSQWLEHQKSLYKTPGSRLRKKAQPKPNVDDLLEKYGD